jgi:hypothetical protein
MHTAAVALLQWQDTKLHAHVAALLQWQVLKLRNKVKEEQSCTSNNNNKARCIPCGALQVLAGKNIINVC